MLPSFAKLSPKKQQRLEAATAESRHQTKSEEEASAEMTRNGKKSALPSAEAAPLPSKLKRFRVHVPSSMDAGELMNIRLDHITTKIQITAPTTKTTINKKKKGLSSVAKQDFADHESPPPSPTPTSCSNTTSAASSSHAHTTVDKYAAPHYHDRTRRTSSKSATSSKAPDRTPSSVLVTTEIRVPDGKRMMEAKSVVVIHAVFPQTDKALKEAMIDEVMRHMTQETLDCGCNAMLGMTITIKSLSNKPETGFLVKASGTPCLLLPTQVVVSSSSSSSAAPLRPRTSSLEDVAPLLTRRQ